MGQAGEPPIFTDDAIRRAIAALAASPAFAKPQEPVDRSQNMHRYGLPILAGGAAADALTTLLALQDPQNREANPALGGLPPWALVAAKAGANGFGGWALDKAAHKGHKSALPLAVILGALQAAAAVNNARHIR